jgi:hypothetical protein
MRDIVIEGQEEEKEDSPVKNVRSKTTENNTLKRKQTAAVDFNKRQKNDDFQPEPELENDVKKQTKRLVPRDSMLLRKK